MLWLLALLDERETMLPIAAQITSPSVSQRDYALELLILTVSPAHKDLVSPLVADLDAAARLEKLEAVAAQSTLDPSTRLADILRRPAAELAPWPRACALYAIGLGRREALHPETVAVHNRAAALRPGASPTDNLIGETAAWALGRLDKENVAGQLTPGVKPMRLIIEKVIALKGVDIFSQIPDEILADLAQRVAEIELAAGQQLFAQGDAGDSMYVVVDGLVRVDVGDHELVRLGVGEVFGEMAILDPAPRMASVTAEADTLLLELPQHTLNELMSVHGEVAQGIIRVLSGRLRQRSEEVRWLQAELARREG